MEAQFDLVIADRPLIIHRLLLLSTLLPDQPILTWDFFLQRFDSLSMEAQIQLEKTGEIAYPQGKKKVSLVKPFIVYLIW